MHENDLYGGFKEVHKLVILVLTIPFSTASAERSFTALKRAKTYLKNIQGLCFMAVRFTVDIRQY